MRERNNFSEEFSRSSVAAKAVQLLPLDFCLEKHCVVLEAPDSAAGKPATVGMLHPDSERLVSDIEAELGQEVKTVQLNALDFRRALTRGYDVTVMELEEIPTLSLAHDCEFTPKEVQSPTRILRAILSEAIKREASDVHLERPSESVNLRFRIEGILRQFSTSFSLENFDRVITKLKVMADLDITEHRKAQDGHFSVAYEAEGGVTREIDIRLNIIPGPHGEEAVMRILDQGQFILDFEELGFNDEQLRTYRDLIDLPSGILLTVGPTGSGKTTTLYCAVAQMLDEKQKIITAEEPIECEFENVNQKQISPEMGYSDYTRAFLRQDPDIMLIGEIRDWETADNCVRAGNTGHLVLSTLHTSRSITAISRLRSLGVKDDHLAEVLNGIIAQRLVRVVCENCKVEVEPDSRLLRRFYETSPDHPFYRGEGCELCDQTGYRGRTGIFEMLVIDRKLRGLISAGVSTEEIKDQVEPTDFKSLCDQGLQKVKAGITSLEEVARVVSPPDIR